MQFTSLNETVPAANPVATAIADLALASVDQAGEFLAFIAALPQAVAPDKEIDADDIPAATTDICLAFPVSLPIDPVHPALSAATGLLPLVPTAGPRPAAALSDRPPDVAPVADFAEGRGAIMQDHAVPAAQTLAGLPPLSADDAAPSLDPALPPPLAAGEAMVPARPVEATETTADRAGVAQALAAPAFAGLHHSFQPTLPDSGPMQAIQRDAGPGATQASTIELAQRVAGQITSAMVSTSDSSLEIRLDPPELGRVQISLEMGDAGVRAVVQAERTDVAELMRRHAALLQDSLQSQGFSGISMEFRSGNDLPQQADPRQWGLVQTGEIVAVPDDLSGPIVNLRQADGGLDIRL